MKVLFPFVGDTVGGSHKSSILLIKALSSYGIETIVLIHKKGILKNFLLKEKIKFVESNLPFWKEKKSPFINFFQIILLTPLILFKLKSIKVNIVHVNDGTIRNSWSLATKILNIKLISHQRNIFDNSRISFLQAFLANEIISISKFVKNSMPERFHKKITIIKNPFSKEKYINKKNSKNLLIKKFSIKNNPYLISIIGTVNNRKRPLEALKTHKILRERGINCFLLYVGSISKVEKKLLDAEIQKNKLKDFTRIIGYKNDIKYFLSGSDVILAPAINEGFGRVLIEAMLFKTPIIASDHGAHKEIIRNEYNGFLTKTNNPYLMADAVEKILKDKKLERKIINSAKKFAISNFSIENHVESILRVYKK